jgi:hypothetical protein
MPKTSMILAIAIASWGVAIPAGGVAHAGCGQGGPPPGAASKDVSDAYGRPATLWLTDTTVGITTADGYGQAEIRSPSPLRRSALLVDAQLDGQHQVIVDTGREAILYAVSGCTITAVVDRQGAPFRFDRGHRRGNGDGIGCSDLGDGRRLVGLLRERDADGSLAVRRTEIDVNGATATIGRADTVPAASQDDPAWRTAADISCGALTVHADGLTEAP